MDKNGKLFGKVSIIDILVLLAVIVGIAGFSVRFFCISAGGRRVLSMEIKDFAFV